MRDTRAGCTFKYKDIHNLRLLEADKRNTQVHHDALHDNVKHTVQTSSYNAT